MAKAVEVTLSLCLNVLKELSAEYHENERRHGHAYVSPESFLDCVKLYLSGYEVQGNYFIN